MPKYRIEAPSLLLSKETIRSISCGEGIIFFYLGYCLMSDCEGKAWSFGVNDCGQLGLGHLR